MITTRRSFVAGFSAALITAPAIVRASSLMPVKSYIKPVRGIDIVRIGMNVNIDVIEISGCDQFGNSVHEIITYESMVDGSREMVSKHGTSLKQFRSITGVTCRS